MLLDDPTDDSETAAVSHRRSWRVPIVPTASVAVPALGMLAFCGWHLNRPSMFGSEADTYWAAQLGVGHLFHLLRHIDAVHGTYYLFMHAWFAVHVGTTWMRVPSLLALSGAVAMTSVLARKVSGSYRVGFVAAILLAVLPSMTSWAQSGRSYALIVFAVTLLMWTFLRAVEVSDGRAWPRWVAFGAATTVCGYLHEMTLLLVPAFAVTLLWTRIPRAVALRWLATTAIAGALVTPLLVISSRQSAAVGYLRPPNLATLHGLFRLYFGPIDTLGFVLAAFALIAVFPVRPRFGRGVVTPATLALPVLVIPAALLFTESRVRTPLFDGRYVLYGAVGAVILTATGVERVGAALMNWSSGATPRRVLAIAPALVLCVLATAVPWSNQLFLRTPAGHGQDYGGASTYLAARSHAGDGVVFGTRSARSAKLGYPSQFRKLNDFTLARTAEQTGTFVGTAIPDQQLRGKMLARDRIWVIGPFPIRRSPYPLPGLAYILIHDFHPSLVKRFAGIVDALYLRNSAGHGPSRHVRRQ